MRPGSPVEPTLVWFPHLSPRTVSGTQVSACLNKEGAMATQGQGTSTTNQQLEECISLCLECVKLCNQCAVDCINQGSKDLSKCIQLCLDCADICTLCVGLMSRNSSYAAQVCAICADICDACATECEKGDGGIMRQCAEACRRCAEACRKVAA